MIALSLRQPWAAAVLHVGKNIENRRWPTKFRGEFLIHAAKAMTKLEHSAALDFCEAALWPEPSYEVDAVLAKDRLVFGAIVGRARLVEVFLPCPGAEKSPAGPWHMHEQHGFLLEDVVAFATPIPWKGALGFFDVPFDREGAPDGR